MTGWFLGSLDFGGGALTSAAAADVFVAKLSPDGTHLWSKRFGGVDGQWPAAIALDAAGNAVVLGMFESAIDLGGGPLTATPALDYDVFVAKLASTDGVHLWSRRFGGQNFQWASGLAVDAADDVVVGGFFESGIDCGGGPLTSPRPTVGGFIAKLTGDGSHRWSTTLGGPAFVENVLVATDASRNVLLAGTFYQAPIDLGGGPLLNGGISDGFVGKLGS